MSNKAEEWEADAKAEWVRKIESGERIRTYANATAISIAAICSLATLRLLPPSLKNIYNWATGHPEKVASSEGEMRTALIIAVLAVLGLAAALLAILYLLRSTIEFGPGYLELSNWRGKARRIEFAEIVAATSWEEKERKRSKVGCSWGLSVCYSIWGLEMELRWRRVYWGDREAVEAMSEAIVRHSELTEATSGASDTMRWQTWQRPGLEALPRLWV